MNEIINKFLLAGDKCMSEMHLKQPGFLFSAYGPFNIEHKCLKKLDKVWFQHDRTYGDFKDLLKRTATEKVFHDKIN